MANNSSYWYCPKCKEELDGCHVTYQELCEYCGTAVLSVPESISQETIEEIIKAKIDQITREIFIFEYEAAEKVLPTCNVTKLPCAGCNPVCEHREE